MIQGTITKAVWIARVPAVLYALFLMLFSFDVFGGAGVTAKEIGAFPADYAAVVHLVDGPVL